MLLLFAGIIVWFRGYVLAALPLGRNYSVSCLQGERLDGRLAWIHAENNLTSQTTRYSSPIGWLQLLDHRQVATVSSEDVVSLIFGGHLGTCLVRREALNLIDDIVGKVQLRDVHRLAIYVGHYVNVRRSESVPT